MSEMGQCLVNLKKFQDAVELLQRALDIQTARLGEADLETVFTFGRLASAYSRNGSFEKASKCFRKAIEARLSFVAEHSDDAGNLVSLAGLYINQGHMLRRQRKLAEVIEPFSQALEILQPIESARSAELQTKCFSGRSTTFAMMQRWDEAIQDANQSALHATTASSECAALVLKAYFLALGSGDVDESIDIVEGVLRRKKESVDLLTSTAIENVVRLAGAICNHGNRLRENHEPERAIEFYATAIRFLDLSDSKMAKDNRANTYLNRARALVDMARMEEACDDVDRAVENAPTADRADFMLMWKARVLAQRGMANETMRIIEDVTERKSEDSDLYFAARTLALCAQAIHQARSNETSRSTQQFSACVTKCIALLAKANDVGYFHDRDRIVKFLNEKDFASVRSVPEFDQFTRQISKLMKNEVSNHGNNPRSSK
jgi:pentatricopeptide repeat protein